jgi:AAA15 family ATPase/GTPase
MIKDIEISNFRCFEHTKIEGFERVNLIGGKNNSGKTALLEAIFLYSYPYPNSIHEIREAIRNESLEVVRAIPKNAWENLLFNLEQENIIELKGYQSNQADKLVKISISDSLKDSLIGSSEDLQKLYDFIAKNKSVISILNLQTSFDLKNDSKDSQLNYFLIASSDGILALPDVGNYEPVIIAASVNKSLQELSEAYTKIVFNEQVESKNDKIFIETLVKHLNFTKIQLDKPICFEEDDYKCLQGLDQDKLTSTFDEIKATIRKKAIPQADSKCSMNRFDYVMKNKPHIWNFEHEVLNELKKFLQLFAV